MTALPIGGYTLADLNGWSESTDVELLEGAIIVNPPRTMSHQRRVDAIRAWLAAALPELLVVTSPGIELGEHDGLIPDVAVFRPGCPTDDYTWNPAREVALVVEVTSPSTRLRDRGDKYNKYFRAGIPHYWIVEGDGVWEYNFISAIGVLDPDLCGRMTHDLGLELRWND